MSAPMPCELRETRLRLGIKQLALAAEIGVSPQALSSWETGQRCPNFQKYQRWLRALETNTITAENRLTADATRGGLTA